MRTVDRLKVCEELKTRTDLDIMEKCNIWLPKATCPECKLDIPERRARAVDEDTGFEYHVECYMSVNPISGS